jgi:hypothetical protein
LKQLLAPEHFYDPLQLSQISRPFDISIFIDRAICHKGFYIEPFSQAECLQKAHAIQVSNWQKQSVARCLLLPQHTSV